jgi:cytochrome c-type biogenesis protein CcmH/NrfG
MSVSRGHLLTRREDLYAAIRQLEQDHREGTIDGDAYQTARHRYELEAADVLAQLDSEPDEDAAPRSTGRTWSNWKNHPTWLLMTIFVGLIVVALALFLITAAHPLQGTGASSPSVATPRVPAALTAAVKQTERHPRSVSAFLSLGNTYLNLGDSRNADRAYRRAMALDPSRPEAKTLHALLIGSTGHYIKGLALLRQVEQAHPTYSRAWLLDGLLSTHLKHGSARAIAAWQRFLAVDPHNPLAPRVRQWIAGARKAQRGKKP